MQGNINYEDNIFILNTRIRMVSDLLFLDADPMLYFDKMVEDLDFIGKTAKVILQSLMENKQLIDWDEQIRNLYDTEERYFEVLGRILSGGTVFSINNFPKIAEIVGSLAAGCTERQRMIKENIENDVSSTARDPHVVSVEELSALLADLR